MTQDEIQFEDKSQIISYMEGAGHVKLPVFPETWAGVEWGDDGEKFNVIYRKAGVNKFRIVTFEGRK